MEYTIKNKLLALIFPAVCVIYGFSEFRTYLFENSPFGIAMFRNLAPMMAILGGIITGFIAVKLRIDFVPYMKVLTIGTVISYLLFFLIVTQFRNPVAGEIFHIAVLAGAVFLMTVKMPDEASARDRLITVFANPVLYSLLNKLFGYLLSYLYKVGALLE